VISELPDQKKIEGLGGTMRLGVQDVKIEPGTLASFLFNDQTSVRQRFRHRYEVEPAWIERLEAGGMIFSGRHPDVPIMQVLELPQEPDPDRPEVFHPYFVGAQFHPELTSRPLRPQPLFMGLVASAIRARYEPDEQEWARLSRNKPLTRWFRDLKSEQTV
jgi:CTP synthase